jgi:CMP-N,N'-diacetyllegionaminic acid synthase
MADVVALIPARSGSKGVPDKNIKLLAGRPLLAYSIAAARLAINVQRIVVSTDSEHYASIAQKYGAEVPFLRPVEISGDNSPDYEWIRHTLDWMQKGEGYIPSYLVHLRPTTPLREPMYIEEAVKRLMEDTSATALRSSHEMSQSSYKTLEIEGGYYKCIATGSLDLDAANRPRQEFKKTYDPNGYVDVYRSRYIIENRKILGNRVHAYITPFITEVDTLEEFEFLEYQIHKNPRLVSRLFNGA